MKKIIVAKNKFKADLIAQTLHQEGIACMIRSYHDTAYDGIFIPQKEGAIMVPIALIEKSSAIIAGLREGPQRTKTTGENIEALS